MLRRSIAILLLVLVPNLIFASSAPAQSQTVPAADTIRAKVSKIGLRHDITVTLNNKGEYRGTVEAVENETFKIYEVDLKHPVEFKFAEVRKVEKGYAGRNMFGQKVSRRTEHIGSAVGIVGAVLFVVFLHGALKD